MSFTLDRWDKASFGRRAGRDKHMQTEQAGMELMSGCLALLALPVIIFLARLSRVNQASRAPEARERLTGLLIEFASGADRSGAKVRQIEALLMALLATDRRYEDLLSAVASFQPGRVLPFHDEQWLAEVFRAYLAKRRVTVTETIPRGLWPPPPGQTV